MSDVEGTDSPVQARSRVYSVKELIEACPRCMAHFAENPWALREAFASVGIEHDKSSAEMAASYFAVLHQREKHSDTAEQPVTPEPIRAAETPGPTK